VRRVLVVLPLLAMACSAPPDGEATESTSDELTATDPVSAAVSQSCSTTAVKGLSQQLVDEINCLEPGTLTSIAGINDVSLGSAVFPYLQVPAASALGKAVAARGTTMTINSALRTLPQQYLLYEWYLQGRCGIGLAASPGNSNHESGLAVDIDDHTGWDSSMTSRGWKWLGSSDPVHFDYVAGGIDLRSLSVLAFQKLWNENNPNDTITEDGAYGADTEKRLVKSPVGGFPKGATCKQTAPDAGTSTKDAGTVANDAAPEAEADATPPPVPHADAGVGGPLPQPSGCSMGRGSASGGLPIALAFLGLIGRKRRRLAGKHPEC
jgi:MYXO-CTERM domain-containing protein